MRGAFIILLFVIMLGLLTTSGLIFRHPGWHSKLGSVALLAMAFVLFIGALLFAAPI